MLEQDRHYLSMDGKTIFRHAVGRLLEVIEAILQKNRLSLDDIRLLVPHQANLRINEMVARKLGLERVYNKIQCCGNTTVVSIPIALHKAAQQGRINKGNLVFLVAPGSRFTWGDSLRRW